MDRFLDMYRELDVDDMNRMRIPRRYWEVSVDGIQACSDPDGMGPEDIINNYLNNLKKMRKLGGGLVLWGPNGSGKTSIAVVIMKEFRRHGYPGLFIEASKIKDFWVSGDMFDEDERWRDRITDVDVLTIDDLGKGIADSTGFGATVLDEIVRTRNSKKLVTMITSNVSPKNRNWVEELELKVSTQETLIESFYAICVESENKRRKSYNKIKQTLEG